MLRHPKNLHEKFTCIGITKKKQLQLEGRVTDHCTIAHVIFLGTHKKTQQ